MESVPSKPYGKNTPSLSHSEHLGSGASWTKSRRTYQPTIENPPKRPMNHEDYGMDNFSYDEAHIPDAGFPEGLLPRLPSKIAEHAKDFIMAYAAVETAFERIQALDKEAVNRVDVKTTHPHLFRRTSDQTPTVVGAETPPSFSTPEAPRPSMLLPYASAGSKKSLMPMIPQLPVNMMGLESPPFTPVDSKVANTPVNEPLIGPKGMVETDLARVSAKLSKTALTIQSSGIPVKNEIAWRTYVGQFNAEIDDIKNHAFKRVAGYQCFIMKELYELVHDEKIIASLSKGDRVAIQEFRGWWLPIQKKVSDMKTRVMALDEKVVGTRTELQAMDMKAAAWPL